MDPTKRNSQIFPSQAELTATYTKSISTETSLADLSITLPENAIGVEFMVVGAGPLYLGVNSADANNAGIPQYVSYAVWNIEEKLNSLRLFAAAATDVSIFVYIGE